MLFLCVFIFIFYYILISLSLHLDSEKQDTDNNPVWHKVKEKIKVACVFCDESFDSEHLHTIHHESDHPGKPYICQFCNKKQINKKRYIIHKWQQHIKPYACNFCNYRSYKISQVKNHVISKHTSKSKITKNNAKSKNSNKLEENSKKTGKVYNLELKEINEGNEIVDPEVFKGDSEKITKNEIKDYVNSENELIVTTRNTDETFKLITSDFEEELNKNQTDNRQAVLTHSIFDTTSKEDDGTSNRKEENKEKISASCEENNKEDVNTTGEDNCDASFEDFDSFGDGFDEYDQHSDEGEYFQFKGGREGGWERLLCSVT